MKYPRSCSLCTEIQLFRIYNTVSIYRTNLSRNSMSEKYSRYKKYRRPSKKQKTQETTAVIASSTNQEIYRQLCELYKPRNITMRALVHTKKYSRRLENLLIPPQSIPTLFYSLLHLSLHSFPFSQLPIPEELCEPQNHHTNLPKDTANLPK